MSLYRYDNESTGIPSHFSPLPTPHSRSPPKYPSRPPSSRFQLSTDNLRPPSATLGSPSPPPPPSANAISLNDIISNPSELEHFKVLCVAVLFQRPWSFHCFIVCVCTTQIVLNRLKQPETFTACLHDNSI